VPEQADAFARVLTARLAGVIENEEELTLAPLIEDQFVQDSSMGWPGVVLEIPRPTESRCREILGRVVALEAAWTPTLSDETIERVLDILVLAEPPVARRGDRAWIVDRGGNADAALRAIWHRLAVRLEELEPILAATLALRRRTSLASRFLDESHLAAVRLRPWVQRVQVWREVPARARPSGVPAPQITTAASTAAQPEGSTPLERRAVFEALRAAT
jgi:hypothetical protein